MTGENLGFQMFLPLLGQTLVGVPMGYLRQQAEALWKAQDAANMIWEAEGEPGDKEGGFKKSPQLAQADAEVKKREQEVWQAVKASTEFQEGTPRWLRHLAWAWLLSELFEFPAEIVQAVDHGQVAHRQRRSRRLIRCKAELPIIAQEM